MMTVFIFDQHYGSMIVDRARLWCGFSTVATHGLTELLYLLLYWLN
jgi:hypothetical protein